MIFVAVVGCPISQRKTRRGRHVSTKVISRHELLQYLTIALTLFAGYAVKTIMLYKPELSGPDHGGGDGGDEDDETDPPRNFTQKQLREFDGTADKDGNNKPVYLSVNGIVFDMSKGRNFYGPGGPYEKFAGRECGVGTCL